MAADKESDAPPEALAHGITCLTADLGDIDRAHPRDRWYYDDRKEEIVAYPPYRLTVDAGTPQDEFLGQFPFDPDIARALIFRRTVPGGEDGYPEGQIYVLMRFRADPDGVPVRMPVPHGIDGAILQTVQLMLTKNAPTWGFDPP